MPLTQFSDYGLRALIYLGLTGSTSTIAEISRTFQLSEHHVARVVQRLARLGYIRTTRGRGGGVELARDAAEINIGHIVEQLEPGFRIAECHNRRTNSCRLAPVCRIGEYFAQASRAFLGELRRHSLADVLAQRSGLEGVMSTRGSRRTRKG